jgi:hypothetical protein
MLKGMNCGDSTARNMEGIKFPFLSTSVQLALSQIVLCICSLRIHGNMDYFLGVIPYENSIKTVHFLPLLFKDSAYDLHFKTTGLLTKSSQELITSQFLSTRIGTYYGSLTDYMNLYSS